MSDLTGKLLVWLTILIGIARPLFLIYTFNSHVSQGYQAVAHIWVGMLVVFTYWHVEGIRQDNTAICLWSLIAVEVICATLMILQKSIF